MQQPVACADEGSRESVDAKCRRLTATWVRERHASDHDIEVCDLYEQLERAGSEALLEPGVYTMHDLRIFGRKQGWCPYFLARHMLAFANVVVYNYQYMLDPKVSYSCPQGCWQYPMRFYDLSSVIGLYVGFGMYLVA